MSKYRIVVTVVVKQDRNAHLLKKREASYARHAPIMKEQADQSTKDTMAKNQDIQQAKMRVCGVCPGPETMRGYENKTTVYKINAKDSVV
jgi:hypothetical protein